MTVHWIVEGKTENINFSPHKTKYKTERTLVTVFRKWISFSLSPHFLKDYLYLKKYFIKLNK